MVDSMCVETTEVTLKKVGSCKSLKKLDGLFCQYINIDRFLSHFPNRFSTFSKFFTILWVLRQNFVSLTFSIFFVYNFLDQFKYVSLVIP